MTNHPLKCSICEKSFAWGEDEDSAIVDRQEEHRNSCRENAHWKLTFHFHEEHSEHLINCNGADAYWQVEPNGDKTCSYCGSLSEEDFIDILSHYVEGDEGYEFEPSTKSYKHYARRPNVVNAGQGGIKFYTNHIDRTPGPDLEKRKFIFGAAMEKYQEEFKQKFGH